MSIYPAEIRRRISSSSACILFPVMIIRDQTMAAREIGPKRNEDGIRSDKIK